MKTNPLLLIMSSLFLGLSSSLLHATTKVEDKPTQIPEFPIFAEANKSSKIIEKANLKTPIIKIIKQNEWIKVADTSNGFVGWIHEEDYKKAAEVLNKPQAQSILIHIIENKTPQKMEIIAYKNGTKMDEKEANAVYEQFKKQQETREKAMKQWFNSMHALFNKMHNETFLGGPFLEDFPIIQPVIVVESPPATPKPDAKPAETSDKTPSNTTNGVKN